MSAIKSKTLYGKPYDAKEQEVKEKIVRLKHSVKLLKCGYRWMHKPAIKILEEELRKLGAAPE